MNKAELKAHKSAMKQAIANILSCFPDDPLEHAKTLKLLTDVLLRVKTELGETSTDDIDDIQSQIQSLVIPDSPDNPSRVKLHLNVNKTKTSVTVDTILYDYFAISIHKEPLDEKTRGIIQKHLENMLQMLKDQSSISATVRLIMLTSIANPAYTKKLKSHYDQHR